MIPMMIPLRARFGRTAAVTIPREEFTRSGQGTFLHELRSVAHQTDRCWCPSDHKLLFESHGHAVEWADLLPPNQGDLSQRTICEHLWAKKDPGLLPNWCCSSGAMIGPALRVIVQEDKDYDGELPTPSRQTHEVTVVLLSVSTKSDPWIND
jgi:hypothetical protein